jgi:hypothetical protein
VEATEETTAAIQVEATEAAAATIQVEATEEETIAAIQVEATLLSSPLPHLLPHLLLCCFHLNSCSCCVLKSFAPTGMAAAEGTDREQVEAEEETSAAIEMKAEEETAATQVKVAEEEKAATI